MTYELQKAHELQLELFQDHSIELNNMNWLIFSQELRNTYLRTTHTRDAGLLSQPQGHTFDLYTY